MKRTQVNSIHSDIVIIGGGLGGCAAALAAAKQGYRVVMTEPTDWIGGQLTAQVVPPDENRWIERFGATRTYRSFRERIRRYYRRNYPLTVEAAANPHLNPGNAGVSGLGHEPRVAVAVLEELLAPYLASGRLTVLYEHEPIVAHVEGDSIRSVLVRDLGEGAEREVIGRYYLDASELGDLLPLAGAEYVTGAESREQTGEMHAPSGAPRPLNMQSFTMCLAIDHLPGENHTIDRPEMYSFWREYVPDLNPAWPGNLLDWHYTNPRTLKPSRGSFTDDGDFNFWRYRRLIDRSNFAPGAFQSDITVLNLPQIDYWLGPICEVEEKTARDHIRRARQLTLSFLYWLQTEAPRPDGGVGYPGLRPRPDVVGTKDGLAKSPYVRESRRIKAQFTVTEEHVGREQRGSDKAAFFADSVGIGHYNIDLHPSTGGDNYIDTPCCPFQIPLGSLIPIRLQNLLPACKNIGMTHITTGCYRLHPVEWNIGEAAGHIAAYALGHDLPVQGVREEEHVDAIQRLLTRDGIELSWPNIGP